MKNKKQQQNQKKLEALLQSLKKSKRVKVIGADLSRGQIPRMRTRGDVGH